MADYKVSDIYQGGYSSLTPKYGNIFGDYRVNPATFGMTTDPRTADILKDASAKLNVGAKHIELSAVTPEVFESIPDQQLKEINRLSKLTGVTVSVHGPILEPSGMTKEGFSDSNRQAIERQMFSAVERSHIVSPDGNVPVTFHSSQNLSDLIPEKGKTAEGVMVIRPEDGKYGMIPLKERNFPGEEKKRDAKSEIDTVNKEQWMQEIDQLGQRMRIGGEIIDKTATTALLAEAEKKAGKNLTGDEDAIQREFRQGTNYLNSSYIDLKQLFEKAQKNSSETEKNKINKFYNDIREKAEKIKENPKDIKSAILMKEIINEGVDVLKEVQPKILVDLNDFARDKTAETISNVAFSSYKKFKDTSPIISIENPPAGGAFGRGEDLRSIIEEARKKFVEKAINSGMDEENARKQAEKLIGITWDVGHINMIKKYGYENKDIIQETEKVAPFVKHIHLSDNFGFEHTELPMGMGNVPMKEILAKLGQEGFDAKKIIEAGNWWQHFQTSPFKETLEAFGSPIYSMQMAPYWNQNLGLQQNYYGGYGSMLPQTNYESFGAGFSHLPSELGGQRAGAEGSRMSGKGME
jgi:sugar phosphate isomerase/epimerase